MDELRLIRRKELGDGWMRIIHDWDECYIDLTRHTQACTLLSGLRCQDGSAAGAIFLFVITQLDRVTQ